MLKFMELRKSPLKTKKFQAVFMRNGRLKRVNFGAAGYSDYTIHHDTLRRERYRQRHIRDNLSNPLSPGALSWYILWGPSTSILKNLKEYIKKFSL